MEPICIRFSYIPFSAWKNSQQSIQSISDILYRSFYDAFLIRGINMISNFKNLQACGYHISPSVETECLPYPSERMDRKRSATNIFCSFDILNPRISLFVGSIAIQSQMNSEPILFTVSSTMNSEQPSD
jgi:hypothetical protein